MPLRPRTRHYAGFILVIGLISVVAFAVLRDTPISTDGFTPFRIAEIDLAQVTPDDPVDFMEIREAFPGESGVAVATWGSACATAENEAACLAELSEAETFAAGPTHQPCGMCSGYTLVATRGDDVIVVENLRSFVGAIDTPTEAALAASVAQWVRSVDGGYEVVQSRYTQECDPIVEVTTRSLVALDGSIEMIDTHTTREHGVCF